MKQTVYFALLVLLALTACSQGQTPSPQAIKPWPTVAPVASYNIQVTLDTQDKTLTGHEGITYRNTSNVSIPEVVLHLYLNAFKDANSIFLSEADDQHRGFAWDPEHPGWIEVTGIRLADGTSLTLESLEDGTLARASLPTPIPPGGTLTLEVDFHALLPKVFARTGYAGDFFMVGQWFPKLGVWQPTGWNAYPFHVNSEFFADFGTYDVEITLPNGYVTGGAGLLAGTRDNADGTQTVTYHAEAVIDFSWTASPNFKQAARVVDGTEIVYLYLPEHKDTVKRALDAAEAALVNFGSWYGLYPYPRLTVVDVPDAGGGAGGMEYPTLVTAGTVEVGSLGGFVGRFDRILESVIIHEIGHQWWYAMAAFNEAEEPWLDEGFTEYSTARLMQKVYGPHDLIDAGNFKVSDLDQRRFSYLANPGRAHDWQGMGFCGDIEL